MKKNIVLVMVDQMRGDCLGVNNHPVVETPNLDMMAHQGINFENAYSAVPSCIAARAGLLTGLSQKNHGRVGYHDGIPWNYTQTLPSVFSNNGYHTQCIGKMHVYPERSLLGFHNVVLHDGYLNFSRNENKSHGTQFSAADDYLHWFKEKKGFNYDLTDSGLECNSWIARPWMYEEELHPTNWVVTEGIDFLRRRDTTKPFFLKLSFVRPHSPLDPPPFYFNMYNDIDLPDCPIGDWTDTEDKTGDGKHVSCSRGIINKNALNRAKRAYYGAITHIDHQIGRFLMALGEHSLLNNTIILFVSDHGDLMGDHNLFRKALPYEGSTKVPFIIYDPGNNIKNKKVKKVKNLVELQDIMPTLLDLAGVDVPDNLDGKSVRGLIEGNDEHWRDYLHGEHNYGHASNHYIVDGKYKYIWYSYTGEEQLFDLENDKEECFNLINNQAVNEIIEKLRNKLIEELTGREEGYTDGKSLIKGKAARGCLSHIL